MLQVQTRFVGVLECSEESVVTFPLGIPPFVDQRRFVVISRDNSPFLFLQSVDTSKLCFIAVAVQAIDPGYRRQVEPHDADLIGLADSADPEITTLTILTIPVQGQPTANLAAPVLINTVKNLGVQAVRSDGAYSHAHPLAIQSGE